MCNVEAKEQKHLPKKVISQLLASKLKKTKGQLDILVAGQNGGRFCLEVNRVETS